MLRYLLSSLALCFVSMTVSAASFNCDAAVTPTELRVCANATLGGLDEQLAQAYLIALKADPGIKGAQRAWLKERNACADDVCLQTQYEKRIRELSGDVPQVAAVVGAVVQSEADLHSDATRQPLPVQAASAEVAPLVTPAVEPPENEGMDLGRNGEAVNAGAPTISDYVVEFFDDMRLLTLAGTVKYVVETWYLWATLGAMAVGFGLLGYFSRCPSCYKWFSESRIAKDLVGQEDAVRTVTRRDKHRDSNGQIIKTVERQEQAQVVVSTWKSTYKCRSCKHVWHSLSESTSA